MTRYRWTSDFTIEAWVYAASFAQWSYFGRPAMIGNMSPTGGGNTWSFGPDTNNKLAFCYLNDSTRIIITSTTSLNLTSWNHIAMCKTSVGIALFINGIIDAIFAISGTPKSSSSTPLTIGQYDGNDITGYIDDLRITKGFARYGDFTPPTAAFPNS